MKLSQLQENFITENYPSKGLQWCVKNTNLTENQVRYFCYKKKLKLNNTGKLGIANKISKSNRKVYDYSYYYKCNKYSAYILGWIWSDGYVGKYRISIRIAQEDAAYVGSLINYFNDFTKFDETGKNRKPQTTFYLNSVKLCEYLQSCGKYPHSIENYDKLLLNIDKELWVYFF